MKKRSGSRKQSARFKGVPIVEVEWVDSAGIHRWKEGPPRCGTLECTSVGMLAEKTRKQVTVVLSVGENDTWDSMVTIPRACVKRIRVVGYCRRVPASWTEEDE